MRTECWIKSEWGSHAYRKIIFMAVNNGLLPCDSLFATCYLLLVYWIELGGYGQPDVSSRYRVATLLSGDPLKDDFVEFEGVK